jgi:peptidoglycan/xylan/chitin deacetylase (PgdA/CDA1 family)
MTRGHTIASHTWSHADMTTLSYEQLHDELARVEQALIRILGKKPLYVCLPPLHLTPVTSLASLANK